jgi:hypothetical protein
MEMVVAYSLEGEVLSDNENPLDFLVFLLFLLIALETPPRS